MVRVLDQTFILAFEISSKFFTLFTLISNSINKNFILNYTLLLRNKSIIEMGLYAERNFIRLVETNLLNFIDSRQNIDTIIDII